MEFNLYQLQIATLNRDVGMLTNRIFGTFIVLIVNLIAAIIFTIFLHMLLGDIVGDLFVEGELSIVESSIIRRNFALMFFTVFGILLAVWGRIIAQIQIDLSAQASRNDRFAKATDMLRGQENDVAVRSGLHILRDLRQENPETEYVRCSEVIYWFIHSTFSQNKNTSRYTKFAFKILFASLSYGQKKVIKRYKKEKGIPIWYSFSGKQLEWTNLDNVNFLDYVFKDTDITGLDISEIIELNSSQILSAKWYCSGGKGKAPKLSKELEKEVQSKNSEWFKPHGKYPPSWNDDSMFPPPQ